MLAEIGERDDLVALGADLRRREPEQCGREVDVGEPRVLGMEARAELEQRADAPVDATTLPRVGWITPATTFSSVDLPAPFSPMMPSDSPRRIVNDTSSSARNDVRGAVTAQQIPDEPQAAAARSRLSRSPCPRSRGAERVRARIIDGVAACSGVGPALVHTKSSKCGDRRRNTQRPATNNASATASAMASDRCNASRPVEQRVAQAPTTAS